MSGKENEPRQDPPSEPIKEVEPGGSGSHPPSGSGRADISGLGDVTTDPNTDIKTR